MRRLWQTVERDEEVKDVFGKQQLDGSWCAGGAWAQPPSYEPKGGCTPVSPKYVTTAWLLWMLGDMGFDVRDERIQKACDYVLSYQYRNGYIAEEHSDRYDMPANTLPPMPCRFSIILIGLSKVGAAAEPRARRSYDLLTRWQNDDGGWTLEKHREEQNWDRSCPWSTFHATYALYAAQRKKYHKNVIRGLRFLLWHLSQKKPEEIRRFFYHGHSTVHELLMFSAFGFNFRTKPIKTVWDWLMEMYDKENGHFVYSGKPVSQFRRRRDAMDSRVAKYRLHHLIETDWLTYYITNIAVNLGNGDS